jgi:hypothetical protein
VAAAAEVQVIGLKAFARDIKKMGDPGGPLLAQMKQAGRDAADPVAAVVRGRLPHVTGRLAGDVRVTATRTGAAIRMGRASVRYAGWVEFGGHRKALYPSSRPFQPRGRYLFPAAYEMAGHSAELYAAAVNHAINGFTWTNEGNNPHD